MAHGDAGRGSEVDTGEWSGQPAPFTLPRNMVYPALLPLMRTPRLPVVDWTDVHCRFKWTRPFRLKTKSVFCACAITFYLAFPCSETPSVSGLVPGFGMNPEGKNESGIAGIVAFVQTEIPARHARRTAASFGSRDVNRDQGATCCFLYRRSSRRRQNDFSDPVMKFQSRTQLSNGQNKQPKRSGNTGPWDRFINVMSVFVPVIHLLIQLDHLIQRI
jgi:hypothetical protein